VRLRGLAARRVCPGHCSRWPGPVPPGVPPAQRAAPSDRLLAWDFDRAVIAHGELLDRDPEQAIREALGWVLER